MFNIIDLEKWERKEHFYTYSTSLCCSYSITENIDITEILKSIKGNGKKVFPVMLHIISKALNSIQNFKMDYNEENILGYYDFISPMYTVFHEENNTFSFIWTQYDEVFESFYNAYLEDIRLYSDVMRLMAKENTPKAAYTISCLPWSGFTSFSYNIYDSAKFLRPVVTFGKYSEVNNRIYLPFAIQIHHAVADGYHTSLLINSIKQKCTLSINDL